MLDPVSAGSANSLKRVPGDNVFCGGEGVRYPRGLVLSVQGGVVSL